MHFRVILPAFKIHAPLLQENDRKVAASLILTCFTHVVGSSRTAVAPRSSPPRRGRSDRSSSRSIRTGIPGDAAAEALRALAPALSTCAPAAGSFCLGRPPPADTRHSWRCSRRVGR